MAKKKRKKRPPTAPRTATQDPGPVRQERKEQARREREARIKRARRRQTTRRLTRWLIILAVIALIAGIFWWQGAAERRTVQAAEDAARTLGCGEVDAKPDQGRGHTPPYNYATKPPTSGAHAPSTLDPEVSVYEQPIDETLDPQAVHNLEHAYVLMYYSQDAEAPADAVVDALADLARSEDKVILAPYHAMPQGRGLAFVAWNRLQTCPEVTDADDAVAVAKGFISQFRGSGEAPEPTAG
ncbi:MAG TPA: DUF3105 domain-containing protein [Acidimicrobiales bacterium]|jgi:hypothetical protein|nr:DUF3105 domain-containing protein [Acidimicrobiales bacterium]